MRRASLLALTALAAGCTAAPPQAVDCSEDRCESAGSRDELLSELEGHGDPIAAYLREAVDPEGALGGDYRDLLAGVGEILGCSAESERSFVVLSNNGFIPKEIFVRCADDPQAASRFFVALPALDATRDVEPRLLHLSAWDQESGRYRHYSTVPADEGGMRVNAQPRFCLGCHGGPHQLPRWQPLMNEMTNPWSGWNAEPGFSSQMFEEYLDPQVESGPVYQEITAEGLLDSASNLEPVIRAGISRFVGARIRRRTEAADVEEALELVRPVFCDETINFVSEIHRSGEIRSSAIIDGGTRSLVRQLRPGATWRWLERTFRLPPPGQGEDTITLMTVRGESTLHAELSLASRHLIEPSELLRARALDWSHPVGSTLRCSLWREGRERILDGVLDAEIAALPEGATTADLVPLFYQEILRDYDPPSGADLLAVKAPGAEPRALSVDELGEALEEHFQATIQAGRSLLGEQRARRACQIAASYPIAPIFPDLDCR